jgi:hypothetical protein
VSPLAATAFPWRNQPTSRTSHKWRSVRLARGSAAVISALRSQLAARAGLFTLVQCAGIGQRKLGYR